MNKVIEQAYNMQERPYRQKLPEVEIGDVCKLADIWDGEIEPPEYGEENTYSYSYGLTDTDWINYVYKIIEESENVLDRTVIVIAIELI